MAAFVLSFAFRNNRDEPEAALELLNVCCEVYLLITS